MRKLTISLLAGVAVLGASSAALAQERPTRNAELTRAAAQERAATAFNRIDANGDGQINAADRAARQKARFDRVDADGNGAVSYEEFTAQHGKREGQRAARGERPAGHRMGMRGGMRGAAMMGMPGTDANGDGTVTQAEFTAAALARFDVADADENGTVTAAVRKAQRDAMRSQWRERRGQAAS